jgi:hypothetical protein
LNKPSNKFDLLTLLILKVLAGLKAPEIVSDMKKEALRVQRQPNGCPLCKKGSERRTNYTRTDLKNQVTKRMLKEWQQEYTEKQTTKRRACATLQ